MPQEALCYPGNNVSRVIFPLLLVDCRACRGRRPSRPAGRGTRAGGKDHAGTMTTLGKECYVAYQVPTPRGDTDIWVLSLGGDGKPIAYLTTAYRSWKVSFHRDTLAHQESGIRLQGG